MVKFRFKFERPEENPGFLLWQTTTLWQRRIKKTLEAYAISHAQFVIMTTLLWFEAYHYDTTQILIVHWTKLDKMTVSKSLRKLVALGYVKRIEHATDTRAKRVFLTDRGKELTSILVPLVESIDEQFFNKISSKQQQPLIQLLQQLIVKEEQ